MRENEIGAIFLLPCYQGLKIGKLMKDKARQLYGVLEVGALEQNAIERWFYARTQAD